MRNPFVREVIKEVIKEVPGPSLIPEKSFADGLLEGRELGMQEVERMLVILREELARTIQQKDEQMQRADNASDLLLQHIGLRSISMAGIKNDNERREKQIDAVTRLATLPDPLDDLPLDDPRGMFYKNPGAARIAPDYSALEGANFDDTESTLAQKGS